MTSFSTRAVRSSKVRASVLGSPPFTLRSSTASRVEAPPEGVRRTTRTAVYSWPPASKSSRTRAWTLPWLMTGATRLRLS